ncbi:MAG: LLM class F420-dependent oxidoreductase [Anaerolineales bacterium]|nr:LLM class F420-dependent oxidoreductase [Anaerolineales bacterium]
MLKIGVIYPQTEFGHDPAAIKDYAQAAEALGYTHILAYDHVLGANPDRPGGWKGVYHAGHAFHEPFILFTFMAAHTRRIHFATGIIILPQRQTALVAKQAATLDVLSQGRLRLGVGLGWNEVEYTSLGQDFHTRGRRVAEQVALLRRLWTEPLVTYDGRWHTIPDAGLNPLPVQRPIPIWFGGNADPVLRRAARLADGWLPNYKEPKDAIALLETLKRLLVENGRSPSDFGVEARLSLSSGDTEHLLALVSEWQAVGATHLSLNTMGAGLNSPSEHLEAIARFAREVGLQPA